MKIIIITKGSFNNSYIQYERPYLSDITNNYKSQGKHRIYLDNKIIERKTQSEWKIQLTMEINFISSLPESDETRTIHAKSDNIEIMMGSETDEIIEDLFKYLLQRYEERLEESLRGSEFIFDGVDAMYYDLNKVSLYRGSSYIDSPEWLRNKKATINRKSKDNKCFQYALTVALNHKQIKKNPQRISNIKPFIKPFIKPLINFSSHRNWKKFESNNESIALNILYVPDNNKEIRHAHKSKYNLKRENQVILLMITGSEKWYYLAVKSLSALLRGIIGNNNGDFYCMNCFRS